MNEPSEKESTSSAKEVTDNPFLKKTKLAIGLTGIAYFGGRLCGLIHTGRGIDLKISFALTAAMCLVMFARGIKQKTANLSSGMKEVQEGSNDDPA
jgi:hypothetical protein